MAKQTPRQIADSLAVRFHERMVELSTGAAEEKRAAYAWVFPWLADISEYSGRVTRKDLYRVWRKCHNEATALQHHQEFADALKDIMAEIAPFIWPESINAAGR